MAILSHKNDDTLVIIKPKTETKLEKPKLYRVILLNDDYTPMEFVVAVLQHVFGKAGQEAVYIMLQVHNHGSAVCGVYTKEIAETKMNQVLDLARKAEHPLMCKMEKE